MDLIERAGAIAADMERAADLDEHNEHRPVTRFDARRWAEEVRALATDHEGAIEALERIGARLHDVPGPEAAALVAEIGDVFDSIDPERGQS